MALDFTDGATECRDLECKKIDEIAIADPFRF
jgi:hypothetical protein